MPTNARSLLDRLVAVISAPHPLKGTVRQAAMSLESLAREPRNQTIFASVEGSIAELAMSTSIVADRMAVVLFLISSASQLGNATTRPLHENMWGARWEDN